VLAQIFDARTTVGAVSALVKPAFEGEAPPLVSPLTFGAVQEWIASSFSRSVNESTLKIS
jgi:hypothetical protein